MPSNLFANPSVPTVTRISYVVPSQRNQSQQNVNHFPQVKPSVPTLSQKTYVVPSNLFANTSKVSQTNQSQQNFNHFPQINPSISTLSDNVKFSNYNQPQNSVSFFPSVSTGPSSSSQNTNEVSNYYQSLKNQEIFKTNLQLNSTNQEKLPNNDSIVNNETPWILDDVSIYTFTNKDK